MALSKRAKQTAEAGFNRIFPKAKINYTGNDPEGGAETISVNVPKMDRYELQAVSELTGMVPNSFSVTRSGTGISIKFF